MNEMGNVSELFTENLNLLLQKWEHLEDVQFFFFWIKTTNSRQVYFLPQLKSIFSKHLFENVQFN